HPAGRKELDDLKPLLEARPEEICYLDIETTGLSNTPLFLVGLMYSESAAGADSISAIGGFSEGDGISGTGGLSEGDGISGAGDTSGGGSISGARERRLVLDLLFARDYTEERMVLLFLAGIFSRFTTLVTFNGMTFDMPFIMERMAAHRIACTPPATHVDLLRVARRAVGRKTPNHKLQTLEVFLLGRKRKGDIPGSRIPGAYHEFVRTGDAGEMAAVIHHNRLDLYSMLELVTLFLSGR
ncbi:MAG TPA: ribonuclease H-like domain-containing protein, partial [Candidatus Krumholzibacterium sp.]|nr:ribonuclease H-like domain-containing protein [Candidatus Krumholzibacterium sp.]